MDPGLQSRSFVESSSTPSHSHHSHEERSSIFRLPPSYACLSSTNECTRNNEPLATDQNHVEHSQPILHRWATPSADWLEENRITSSVWSVDSLSFSSMIIYITVDLESYTAVGNCIHTRDCFCLTMHSYQIFDSWLWLTFVIYICVVVFWKSKCFTTHFNKQWVIQTT